MEFFTIAKDFGIPIALLIFLCIAIWKVFIWLGTNVVKPLTDRHIAFIDKIERSILDQTKNLDVVTLQNKENVEHIKDVIDQMREIKSGVENVKEIVIKASAVQIVPNPKEPKT